MISADTLVASLKKSQRDVQPYRPSVTGRLVRVVGLTLEAVGVRAPVGSQCIVETSHGDLIAEVVGFSNEKTFLMPEQSLQGVIPGARVVPKGKKAR